ncbi:MAG: hypothetical protein ACRD38_03505 [Nitrososphaerales archaeon]
MDLRSGHTAYLAFILSIMNFVILSYVLALERMPILNQIFPTMWMWAVFYILVYIPAAMIIGHFHRHGQLHAEHVEQTLRNPVTIFELKRLDELAEAIEKICQRLSIEGIEIQKWKDRKKNDFDSRAVEPDE